MGVIYKITNKLDGKIYVGKTARTLEIRMKEHLRHNETYIERALKKYGIEAFEVSVIEECDSEEKLNEREMYWIALLDCRYPNGYNMSEGSEGSLGHTVPESMRQKLSAMRSGKKLSLENRQNIGRGCKGKRHSEKTKAILSSVQKQKHAVICVESRKIFDSITAAAKSINVTRSTLRNALDNENRTAGGLHWISLNEKPTQEYKSCKRSIRCVETNEIFESIAAAAKWAKVASNNVSAAVNGRMKSAGGYHWVDAN